MLAFSRELGKLPQGLDECGVVTGAGEVHCGLKLGGEGRVAEGIEGAADVELDCVETGLVAIDGLSEIGVGTDLGLPVITGGFVCGGRGLSGFDHLRGVEGDELLCCVL